MREYRVLGLELFGERLKTKIPHEIQTLAERREEYRKNKDFKKSDELRDLIKEKGYVVKDEDAGFKIEKAG